MDQQLPLQTRRELNKQDKLRRIKMAARALFLSKGYDDATMREIAHRADVGLGTLFCYASDKRDLLFLIYNDDQDRLLAEAFARKPREKDFVGQVVGAFGFYYRSFAEQPEFMRYVLRELTFYSSGLQVDRFQRGREAIIAGIERRVVEAKKRGEIISRENSHLIARLLFGVYQAEIRLWLMQPLPQPVAGLRQLRRMMRIVADGLRARG